MEALTKKTSVFRFKQFSVDDSECAMKVGTDAVLLACSLSSNQTGKILDIGSGSGVISLCLAQKNPEAEITAIEIDHKAHLQSLKNFQNSFWNDRLTALNSAIQDFAKGSRLKFDTILCNPPFFKHNEHLLGSRKWARQDIALSFSDLIKSVDHLLVDKGAFYCIIPSDRRLEMISLAENYNLFPNLEIHIKGKKNLKTKRTILSFRRIQSNGMKRQEMIIYNEDNSYTAEYQEYTTEFYLKF